MRLTAVLVVLLGACSSSKVNQGAVATATVDKSSVQNPNNPDEQIYQGIENNSTIVPQVVEAENVTPPQQIDGAFLACTKLLDAADGLKETHVACRLQDAAGKRVEPKDRKWNVVYTVPNIPIAEATVSLKFPTDASRKYDAQLAFTAADSARSIAAAEGATVNVAVTNSETNEDVGSINALVKNVLTKGERGAWLRTFGSAGQKFLDETSGLFWGIDNQSSFTFASAVQHCDSLFYDNFDTWRLPTIQELRIANANGLGHTYAQAAYMGIDSRVDAGGGSLYWSSVPIDSNNAFLVDVKLDRQAGASALSEAGVVCVRD